GPEQSEEASLWAKLHALQDAGVGGVIVVRRDAAPPKGRRPDFEPLPLDFRYTHASFPQVSEPRPPRRRPPVIEVTPAFAELMTGVDVLDIASKVDRSGAPKKVSVKPCVVDVRSSLRLQDVRIDNVVGVLPGSDEAMAAEYIVIGAHYDHIGVDTGGRVGPGADDNASGTSGLLAVASALKVSAPKRSVIFCAFSAEEDGLLGSKAFCRALPVSKDAVVAMINMDMIGRGEAAEVAVLGTKRNPALLDVLKRANKIGKTGIKQLVTGKGDELWQRSDHYSFHQVGIPSLFFFEGLPISRNADYHTWRDRADLVEPKKIENTCKLVHQTAWILANDESRPPSPSSRR
ncbi:MAG: M20/M25/M40 family metallo-hydrolase, partial [Planctomycetes bacterium]|nr:M20/M25/M40 family metallo-hydrolase [Planctomycetota bacterium]